MDISVKSLTPSQVELVHEETVDLLSRHGIKMHDEAARETFARHGADVDGATVRIPAKLLESAIASVPESFTLHARNSRRTVTIGDGMPVALSGCSGVATILDETGDQRYASFGDFDVMAKLMQTSPVLNVANCGSLYPTFSDANIAMDLQMYRMAQLCDFPVVSLAEDERYALHSAKTYLIASGLTGKTVTLGICNSLSPMAWDTKMLGSIRVLAEQNQATNISCCAMAGATSPIYLFAAIVQANAEVLSGIAYSQLVRPGAPVVYGTTSSIFDMRSMALALGAPEYAIISAGCAQMAARYRMPFRSGGGLTDSKTVDAQAGIESALNLFCAMHNGVSLMLQGVGILEHFLAMSFEKWVMDEDIMLRIKRMDKGVGDACGDIENIPDIIAEGAAEGNYLAHDTTLEHYREEFITPILADRGSFEAWRESKSDYGSMTQKVISNRLASYEEPRLPADAQRDLNSFMKGVIGFDPDDAFRV